MFVIVLGLSFFRDVFGLLLVSTWISGVLGALVGAISDSEVIIEALFGNALAPAVAFNFFDVVLELLAVGKALIALYGVVVVFKLLLLALLNGLGLLESSALLQFELFVNPAFRELV